MGHVRATVWSNSSGNATKDEFGMGTVKNLGFRVAEAELKMAVAKK